MKYVRWRKKLFHFQIVNSAFRLLLISLLIATGGLALLASPVQALTINPFPNPLPEGHVGASYNASFTTSGTPPYHWTPNQVPSWLSFSSGNLTAAISGTPTSAGTFPISISVTDATSATASFTSTITVTGASSSLTFTTTTLPEASEGTAYTASIFISGGTSPYTFTITSGALPSGLILDPYNGYISGTPSNGTQGVHSFTINVNDNSSPALSAQRTFSISVVKGSFKPSITISSGLAAGQTKVYVDGQQVATLTGGESTELSLDLGASKTVSVEPFVLHPTKDGVRFKVQEEEITVNEFQPSANFVYYTEYLIELETEPAQITDLSNAGWYQKNKTLNASAPSEVEAESGKLYRFTHWTLPDGKRVNNQNMNFTVDEPGTAIAHYDTYYLLAIKSPYGEIEGGGWYKAGGQANWHVLNDKVAMSGLLGFFQGKLTAVNKSGTEVMDGPKTVNVFWEPDYVVPYIIIPLLGLLLLMAAVGIFFLLRRPGPKPAPYGLPPRPIPPQALPPRPIPQQHTTVVMLGDKGEKQKQLPQSTKEQLMEKFGELLEKYEDEIKATMGVKETPEVGTISEDKMLSAPRPIPSDIYDAEVTEDEDEDETCGFTSKKLLRTVTGPWREVESKAVTLPAKGKAATSGGSGLAVTWSRDIYHEWEILTCLRQPRHKGNHKGSVETVYSLLNTVTEEKTYSAKQKMRPPTPHFTDGMPEMEIADDDIIPADELPEATTK